MAATVHLMPHIEDVVEESYTKKESAEEQRCHEYKAAVTIQSWVRGVRIRRYLAHLNKCAVIIQKNWRGFLGRKFFRELVKKSLSIMLQNFYDLMATKVQNAWRSYYTRKYVFDYYSRKQYLEDLQIRNELIRSELAGYANATALMQQLLREQQENLEEERLARKNHHLMSTVHIPGVYSSYLPYSIEKGYFTQALKGVPVKDYKQKRPPTGSDSSTLPTQLPPLPLKPQGPFKDPAVVRKQRCKPLQPSLRVETDFYSLEKGRDTMKAKEWVTRLDDEMTVSALWRDKQVLKRMPVLSSTGGDVQQMWCGTYSLSAPRHNSGSRNIQFLIPQNARFSETFHRMVYHHIGKPFVLHHIKRSRHSLVPFKTVLPPIPIFDKFNDTYSQGQI